MSNSSVKFSPKIGFRIHIELCKDVISSITPTTLDYYRDGISHVRRGEDGGWPKFYRGKFVWDYGSKDLTKYGIRMKRGTE